MTNPTYTELAQLVKKQAAIIGAQADQLIERNRIIAALGNGEDPDEEPVTEEDPDAYQDTMREQYLDWDAEQGR